MLQTTKQTYSAILPEDHIRSTTLHIYSARKERWLMSCPFTVHLQIQILQHLGIGGKKN